MALTADANTPKGPINTGQTVGGYFTSPDQDENLAPPEQGAMGVINPSISGPAQVGGSNGPATGR